MDLESKNCLFSVWNKRKKHSLPKTKKTKQILIAKNLVDI